MQTHSNSCKETILELSAWI